MGPVPTAIFLLTGRFKKMTQRFSVRARCHRTERSMKRAFTLLELLVTIALLAIVGGLVISQINLDEDGISSNINAYSMGQVRDALLAFRRDMGYFPGQGPLNSNYQKISWVTSTGVKTKRK